MQKDIFTSANYYILITIIKNNKINIIKSFLIEINIRN